jgi:hypothetical protein
VVVVMIGLRLTWMFSVPTAVRAIGGRLLGLRRRFDCSEQLVLGWSGMRGALSIAAALSLPFSQFGSSHLGIRSLAIFLAFAATCVSLVLPGLTLATLIRVVGLGQSQRRLCASLRARLRVVRAALSELDNLAQAGGISERTLTRMRELYETRSSALEARLGEQEGRDGAAALEEERRVHRILLGAQRGALRRLRVERAAPVESLHEIERDLDLEASR